MDKGAWRAGYRTWDRKESDRTEYFLKDDAVTVLHSYVSKFRKLSSGQRARKFQPQRRVMPKNVLTTIQLCSFHMLAGNAQIHSS